MGAYVNPRGMSKEKWLAENGVRLDTETMVLQPYAVLCGKEFLPVVLVDNGPFTAAAIAYSEAEFDAFMDPLDRRPKSVYLCVTADLHTVSPELATYLKQ
jgi:hypothetical protein